MPCFCLQKNSPPLLRQRNLLTFPGDSMPALFLSYLAPDLHNAPYSGKFTVNKLFLGGW